MREIGLKVIILFMQLVVTHQLKSTSTLQVLNASGHRLYTCISWQVCLLNFSASKQCVELCFVGRRPFSVLMCFVSSEESVPCGVLASSNPR